MFDFLKKKISSFVDTLAGKAAQAQPEPLPEVARVKQEQVQTVVAPVETKIETPIKQPQAKPIAEKIVEKQVETPVEKKHEKPVASIPTTVASVPVVQPVKTRVEKTPVVKVEAKPIVPELAVSRPEIELKPKFGILSRIKNVFSPEIEISESELKPVLEQLEIALLESDVSFDATQHFLKELSSRLSGKKVRAGSAGEEIKKQVKESLLSFFVAKPFDLYNYVTALKNEGRVGVILFVGPNGSGKTTTIAKLAKQFNDRGVQCVIAAGDTFRKAAIEQVKVHGERLGVRVVSHQYGADPTAVAFDAVAHAKASSKQVVLIDTAGRQETNFNLVREMEKMDRVLKPDLKIFVGEAIAGNALASQASEFNKAIKLDGIVLTKLDCDAKGGGAFSIAFETKLPILFVGMGQQYDDLTAFDPEWLCNSVLAA